MKTLHPLILIVVLFVAGCAADARTQLTSAYQAKDAVNRSLNVSIETGLVALTPEQAKAIRVTSESLDAYLKLASTYLNEDGTTRAGFHELLDAADAILLWLETELRKAENQ